MIHAAHSENFKALKRRLGVDGVEKIGGVGGFCCDSPGLISGSSLKKVPARGDDRPIAL